ncbi:hypothetical protein LCGC14_0972460 [marine sediment metagenome]|uniref:DNA methylase N-4/N-6 domain-containing protein n=1 Tax=marine sediment metagenome TaxID=412755 RepID=A0A0F9NFS6_9ZZZZ
MEVNKIIQGDCLDIMMEFEDNSIDTIITDPPYGLSFMGKKWDYDVPSIEIWQECLRVLKPGGTALVFAGSRTQHRMAINVEDAGFILKDTIMWLYGSGFPKATDISKQLDKKLGGKVKIGKGFKHAGEYGGRNLSDPTPQGKAREEMRHKPDTPEAQLWNGWKSHGLKPAYEPILVATKPNEGSYAENALKHGVAGLNIDGGRIEAKDQDILDAAVKRMKNNKAVGWKNTSTKGIQPNSSQGRFPANIILDEEAGKMLDEQSGDLKAGIARKEKGGKNIFSETIKPSAPDIGYGGKGGASRFFYCAKASKSERNMRLWDMEKKENSGSYKFREDGSLDGNPTAPRANIHPTVKPLDLMRYLAKLTKTPTGGLVLDPFIGSGTTAMACKAEGRDYIGIEREAEYVKIAEARIKGMKTQQTLL